MKNQLRMDVKVAVMVKATNASLLGSQFSIMFRTADPDRKVERRYVATQRIDPPS